MSERSTPKGIRFRRLLVWFHRGTALILGVLLVVVSTSGALDEWAQPALHYGTAVNGYRRALWFVLGLAPLLLMITGVSTWLYRRRVKRRRRARQIQPMDGESNSTRTESVTASNPMR